MGEGSRRNLRIDVEYDGTDFQGWQEQAQGRSVQETLRRALEGMLQHPVKVHGAGRTDAGVHAEGQVAAFTTHRPIPADRLPNALNGQLPPDISIRAASEVPHDWDPRRTAVERHYRYSLFLRDTRSALECRRAVHYPWPLDVAAMEAGARHLLGAQDFESFRSAGCSAEHATREIFLIDFEREENTLNVRFHGNAFLRHQVRIMMGTLLEVGQGNLQPEGVKRILEGKDRTLASRTAPAHGLTLVRVLYPGESERVRPPAPESD